MAVGVGGPVVGMGTTAVVAAAVEANPTTGANAMTGARTTTLTRAASA
jgi:hypothetical protein